MWSGGGVEGKEGEEKWSKVEERKWRDGGWGVGRMKRM